MCSVASPLKCNCKQHDSINTSDLPCTVHRISNGKVSKNVINQLIEDKLLSTRSLYVCEMCLQYGSSCIKPVLSNASPPSPVDMVCTSIENGTIQPTDFLKLIKAVDSCIHADIYKDILKEKSTYKDKEYLKKFKPDQWRSSQNKYLIAILEALSNVHDQDCNPLYMCRSIESVYHLTAQNIILPLSFSCNLATYLVTGSRYKLF